MIVVKYFEGNSVICQVDGKMTMYLPRCKIRPSVKPGDVLIDGTEKGLFIVNDIETALRHEAIERLFSEILMTL